MEIVKKVEQVGTDDGKPLGLVKIVDCGETSEDKSNNAVVVGRGNNGVQFRKPFFTVFLMIDLLLWQHLVKIMLYNVLLQGKKRRNQ